MRRGRTTTTATLLSGVMIAALVGCTPSEPGLAGGDGGSGNESDSSEAEANGSGGDAAEGPEWLEESDPQARAEGCLPGVWTLDNADWANEVASTPEFAGGSAEYSGEMVLEWSADGSYQMRADDHTLDARVVGNGADADVEIVFDGVEGGTWAASGGTVYAMNPSGEDFTTTASAEVDGFSVQIDSREIVSDAWSGNLDMDCQVDTLATTVDDEDGNVLTARWTRD